MFFSPAFFNAGSFFINMYILKIVNKQGEIILSDNYRTIQEVTNAIKSVNATESSIFIHKRYGETQI